MFASNNKITAKQFAMLLSIYIFGTGVIMLPRRVVAFSEQDGWITVLIALLFACICLFFILKAASIYPNDSFYDYTSKIVSSPIAVLLSAGFAVRIILSVSMEVRIFGEILKQTILYKTPYSVTSALLLAIGAYCAVKGYETRGRIGEILIFLIFVPAAFLFITAMASADYTNLLPVLNTDLKRTVLGGIFTTAAFSGIEFILLAGSFIRDKENIKKFSFKAVIIMGIAMTLITMITICVFGVNDTKRQMWPVIELMNIIEIPGAFLERQDAVTISFWIMSEFMIANAGLFFSSLLLNDIFKKGKRKSYIWASAFIAYAISFVPESIEQAAELAYKINIFLGGFYFFAVPVIIIIFSKLRKAGNCNE